MSTLRHFINESWPSKPTFKIEDILDLNKQVAIVTGANAGIGKETAKALLNHNAKVYFAGRSKERVDTAIQELKKETGKEGIFLHLDLSDLKSVKRAAEEFQSKETTLHMLYNNAGVMRPPIEQLTTQGYDMQFGTNVLGHFYFSKLLLPTLLSTVKGSPDGKVRVINTSSFASRLVSTLDFNTFKDSPARVASGKISLYGQSKLGNVILSNELAKRYGDQGLVSVSLNPGNIESELQRYIPWVEKLLLSWIFYPTPTGALTQLWAGTSKEGANANGKYFIPWARIGVPNPAGSDEQLGGDLWMWMEEQVEGV